MKYTLYGIDSGITRAWTGGCHPQPLPRISRFELLLAVNLYTDQRRMWREYWGDEPSEGVLETYWIRARGDAHATVRPAPKKPIPTTKAWAQHGQWGGPYRTESIPVKQTYYIPRKGQTVSGYGKRLPTSFMVKWKGRWHRVFCVCYSNSGTAYARLDGVDTVVTIQD